MHIENIHRARARNLVLPVNFVQPPGQKIDAGVRALVVAVRAIPVKPPATTHRAQADRLRIPALEGARFGDERVAHFVVGGGCGMHVAMRAAPDIDLVIHVVKMRSRAKRRSQRGRPLIAIDASRRIVGSRLIQQRHVGVVWIGRERVLQSVFSPSPASVL